MKRHDALKPFSRDHHHGLLFCWKIKEGLTYKVDPSRIMNFVQWFWKSHLKAHFKEEELYLFPILGHENTLVIQALEEHRLLQNTFEKDYLNSEELHSLGENLENHIRLEERVLFNEIQNIATEAQLATIQNLPHEIFKEDWADSFWLKKN